MSIIPWYFPLSNTNSIYVDMVNKCYLVRYVASLHLIFNTVLQLMIHL